MSLDRFAPYRLLSGGTKSLWLHRRLDVYVLISLLADLFIRQTSKLADTQTGLADTMNELASKPEWGRNARMKTIKFGRPICWRSTSSEIVPLHPTTPTPFVYLNRLISLLQISGVFYDFLVISFGEAK